ncbi:uncharacterized protein [Amphiura filiformis]|uniref:uncharacterized protein n=1 Tax=Amphiura filiformis TaxID=82378 RepID=UPI003B21F95F
MQQWNLESWCPITTFCDTPSTLSSRSSHENVPNRSDSTNVTSLPIPYRYPCYNNLNAGVPSAANSAVSGFGEDTFSTWNSFEFAAAAAAQSRSVYQSPFNPPAPTPINPTAVAAAAASQHREAAYLSATAATGTSQVSHKPSVSYPFGVTSSVGHSTSWISPVSSSHHRRTKRRPYSKLQIIELEKQFLDNMYLTRDRRTRMSEALNLSERQVKIWFQNRRMKMKKMAERDKQDKEQMEREKQAMNIKLLSITTN